MRKVYFFLFAILLTTCVTAQKNGSVKGVAYDSISKQPVTAVTVTVLDRKDSSLVSFTMTGSNGQFEIKGLAKGDYRILLTHVNYHNGNKYFSITDSVKNADLGNVIINDKTKVLEEVVLANEAPPITLINDTIQYNAGSFKTQPNATVEQLLKKLPGVKVEKDGTIKAQGEKVNRVLVDGKEFFGNDPKVATKNLPADAVDKVQVYDKQSDQAQLTGFEDGNYEKTINLKLKKDKKKGAFGKINAGAGTKDRYEGKFNVNSFKGARQFSAIGMANNTNAEGFSFMDILNFTGEMSRMQSSGGGNININISGPDAAAMGVNGGNNNGITSALGGGFNYNNIIGKKLDLQSNYFYNRLNPTTATQLQRQYILPDSSYFYTSNSQTDNVNNNHRLNFNLLYQLDSMNTIRIVPSVNFQHTNNRSVSNYQTLSQEQNLTNEGFSNTLATNKGYAIKNEITWRKKFARKGRTFSLFLQTGINNSDADGSLYSINNFYTPTGTLIQKDTLNQQSTTIGDLKNYTARAVYTEPIWKKSLLEFSVSRSNSKSTAEKKTWDYNAGSNKFDQLNEQQTNDFENSYGYTNAGFRTRTQRKKYNYSIGVTAQRATLEGTITSGIKDSVITQSFFNLLPNARLQYSFTRFKTVSINYAATTNQPTMTQLQPVPDISDPLNIREGNPDLKQEYKQSVQTQLMLMSPYKNKNLFGFFTFQTTQHKIVNYDSINALGIKRSKPVNVNGVYSFNGNLSYSVPARFLKGSVEFSANTVYAKGKQFINTIANDILTTVWSPEIRVETNPTEKLNIGVGAMLNFNKAKYSLQSTLNTEYFSQEYNASVDWELSKAFFFSTDFIYTINSQRADGFNVKVPMWNASISKQVLKFNRGEIKFSAKDLLNRNIGISRNTSNNYIEDKSVLTLRQYFLLSFTYSLSKMGLNNAAGGNSFKVITR